MTLVNDALCKKLMDLQKEGVLASTNQPKLAWLESARISPTRRFWQRLVSAYIR